MDNFSLSQAGEATTKSQIAMATQLAQQRELLVAVTAERDDLATQNRALLRRITELRVSNVSLLERIAGLEAQGARDAWKSSPRAAAASGRRRGASASSTPVRRRRGGESERSPELSTPNWRRRDSELSEDFESLGSAKGNLAAAKEFYATPTRKRLGVPEFSLSDSKRSTDTGNFDPTRADVTGRVTTPPQRVTKEQAAEGGVRESRVRPGDGVGSPHEDDTTPGGRVSRPVPPLVDRGASAKFSQWWPPTLERSVRQRPDVPAVTELEGSLRVSERSRSDSADALDKTGVTLLDLDHASPSSARRDTAGDEEYDDGAHGVDAAGAENQAGVVRERLSSLEGSVRPSRGRAGRKGATSLVLASASSMSTSVDDRERHTKATISGRSRSVPRQQSPAKAVPLPLRSSRKQTDSTGPPSACGTDSDSGDASRSKPVKSGDDEDTPPSDRDRSAQSKRRSPSAAERRLGRPSDSDASAARRRASPRESRSAPRRTYVGRFGTPVRSLRRSDFLAAASDGDGAPQELPAATEQAVVNAWVSGSEVGKTDPDLLHVGTDRAKPSDPGSYVRAHGARQTKPRRLGGRKSALKDGYAKQVRAVRRTPTYSHTGSGNR